jgi:hypothetical protein
MSKRAERLKQFSKTYILKAALTLSALILVVSTVFQNCAKMSYENASGGTPFVSATGITVTPTPTPTPVTPPVPMNNLGPVSVLGVTGDFESVIDNLLIGGNIPTIHWTDAVNATTYNVTIRQNGQIVCQAKDAMALVQRMGSCPLNLGTYDVMVTAVNPMFTRDSLPFTFQVQDDHVQLTIGTPAPNIHNVTIPYDVKFPSNLQLLTCSLVDSKTHMTIQSQVCTTVRQQSYSNIPYGSYSFLVEVTDKNGNVFFRQRDFDLLAPICDPLGGQVQQPQTTPNQICDQRIKANIFFHPSVTGIPVWNSVENYIQSGIPSGTIYFTNINIPTRSFTNGFPGITARTEYFAFDMRTKIKPSDTMPAGNYQLALLSDDGSKLSMFDPSGQEVQILDNDLQHGTKLGCATVPFAMAAGDKIKLRIKYYQGPRVAISLVFLYRPWSLKDQNSPVACGTENEDFYGTFPVPTTQTSYPGTMYDSLLQQGWKVVPITSFENPDI